MYKGADGLKNCLILLTNSYPFSSEETFLETEMPYLAKTFDKVVTLAVGLGKDAVKTRKVPANVDSYNVGVTSKSVGRLIAMGKGMMNLVFSSKTPKDEPATDIKRRIALEYVYARGEREFALCKNVLEKYDFSQYDSVTVYSYWFFVTALIGCRVKQLVSEKCCNVRLVSRAHGYDVYDYTHPLNYLPLRKYLLENVDAVYPCSADGEKYISEKFPNFKEKIKHRYLGTEDCGVSDINNECFHIVSCSRMVALKRVERIASSLALLKDSGVGALRWTHIGDGDTMQKVREICNEKLGFMRVDLIGRIPNEDVIKFYRQEKADVLLNVSTTEGLPVSMMEVMSFSIPVIATDVGGVGEIVKDGFNGYLLSSDFTDEELAEKLKEYILSAKEVKLAMRKNARDFWKENFDAEKLYSEFAKEISVINGQ